MIIGTVQAGSPADMDSRCAMEQQCYRLLDRLEISYTRVDHGEAATIEQCKAVEQVLGCAVHKNLFLCNRQKTAFYLLIMEGDKPFKTKYLSKQIGSARLSFVAEEDLEVYLGVQPGSVSVLSLLHDTENRVQLIFDRTVLLQPEFGCHPCRNTSTLCLALSDVLDKILPAVNHDYLTVDLPVETETDEMRPV